MVVLNVSRFGCDALIVSSSSDVQRIPLPGIVIFSSRFLVEVLRQLFGHSLNIYDILAKISRRGNSGDLAALRDRLIRTREGSIDTSPNEVFRSLLAELWTFIVEPVFFALKLKANPRSGARTATYSFAAQKSKWSDRE